jgi:hypothetical protein
MSALSMGRVDRSIASPSRIQAACTHGASCIVVCIITSPWPLNADTTLLLLTDR